MKVYQCISAVQKAIAAMGIAKEHRNEMQKYNFRGIDDVYNAMAPLLAEHGLCILPNCLERSVVERPSKNGGVIFYVTVKCDFTFVCAEDGSKHIITTFGEAMDSSDKATNKAMSAAFKYACFQAFCIPLEGEDSEKDNHEPVAKKQQQPPAQQQKAAPPKQPPKQAGGALVSEKHITGLRKTLKELG